eukprot:SAG11_NODE_14569_length_607_cov_1.194882_1_plen_54_part_10
MQLEIELNYHKGQFANNALGQFTRKDNQKMRIILNDLVLPYTWYNVQSSNQRFT